MARSGSTSISVSHRASAADAGCTVVWLGGEHDISTRGSLGDALARAAKGDGGDLLVDLSAVTFMDASTAGALVESAKRLRSQGRSLVVRTPSPAALRVLDVCGLTRLLAPASAGAPHPTGVAAALSTWVAVPRTDLIPDGEGATRGPGRETVLSAGHVPAATDAEGAGP